ncbi:cation transporter [Siculibacillus lacustris]|uniref:Cation transporter n=1 Tax=Siculibacillus lacustris TaxID=1549641 RepID=A0A4Q9VJX5_9HYPH|nr:cation diffusion facilitator family transporter [Siculibacillus lacustris]TBW34758.1 cation transporter [Siculibacillus lacustris]
MHDDHDHADHDHGHAAHGSHDHAAPAAESHDHSHAHDHGHHHGTGHSHAPTDFGRAFRVGIVLNTAFVAVEAGFGFYGNSVALLADAGHNLSDVLALIVAWIAARAAARPPSPRFTYGLAGSSIMAALFNAVVLLIAVGAIVWEAIQRLIAPEPVSGPTMIAVALVGILINGATALMFARGRDGDLNIRGVYLHMLTDAAVSAAVVLAGLTILAGAGTWIDPLMSLIVAGVVVWGTWDLLVESSALSIAAVPSRIDPVAVRAWLAERPGVAALHDLHIWAMSTTETALTAHLVMPSGHPGDAFLAETTELLRSRFAIGHATLQIETDAADWCRLAPEDVI